MSTDSEIMARAKARWREATRSHFDACLADVPMYQARLDAATAPGRFKVEMTRACSYWVWNTSNGRVITGNGETGRSPKVLRLLLGFLEGTRA